MKKQEASRTALSPDQHMARALFHVAKRAWFKESLERDARRGRPRPEPPNAPVPGQGWYADPSTLRVQLKGVSPPFDEGSSVKIKPDETDLLKAFCPRPFLIVSNEYLLDQSRAWVCPLTTSVHPPYPDWVVPLPAFGSYALASKLHTVDTEFFEDFADRDLLCSMEGDRIQDSVLDARSMNLVRRVIERHLAGDFAPARDPLPPGSVLRYPDGSLRVVLTNCDLSAAYRKGGILTTTCRVFTPSEADFDDAIPETGVIPLLGPPEGDDPEAEGAVIAVLDVSDVASEPQTRVRRHQVETRLALPPSLQANLGRLLLSGEEDSRP